MLSHINAAPTVMVAQDGGRTLIALVADRYLLVSATRQPWQDHYVNNECIRECDCPICRDFARQRTNGHRHLAELNLKGLANDDRTSADGDNLRFFS